MSAPESNQKPGAPSRRPPRNASAPSAPPVRNPLPAISFPEELPVSGKREDIARAIQNNQVVIVSGETGSGKTTQLPKICLELGRGLNGLIGHTQPRRIAASSTAKRIAQEIGTPLGEHVGFKVRFNDTLTKGAWIKLMTDGILLAETQTDPLLRQYDTIIIDEAHERSLNIDFLLGYLKQLLPKRPDLKVIITSATIDADRFARHFGSNGKLAPVIEVSGRLYPVEVRYRPVEAFDKNADSNPNATSDAAAARRSALAAKERGQRDLMDAVVDAINSLNPVHRTFSRHYSGHYNKLQQQDQMLSNVQQMHEMRVVRERTKGDRMEDRMKEAREAEDRVAADDSIYDLIDQHLSYKGEQS